MTHLRSALHRPLQDRRWYPPIAAQAAAFPQKEALRLGSEALSWHELYQRALLRVGCWRARAENAPDVTHALIAERSVAFAVDLHAALLAGVPLLLVDPAAVQSEPHNAAALRHYAPGATLPVEDAAHAATPEPWSPSQVLFSVLTSGTTGTPRQVAITAEQVVFSTLGGASRLGSLPSDSWLNPLPLHHVGGVMILLRAAILGFRVVLMDRFDAALAQRQIDAGEVQLVSLVPVMLQALLDARGSRPFPSSLRAILLGGAPASTSLLEEATALGAPVAISWGMSETASQVATTPPGEIRRSPLPLLPFMEADVRGDVLVLRGPMAAGELVTSDRGSVDASGVEIKGRADDVFISGGENIDPREIERALEAHPLVREALVVSLPDRRWGQRPHALVVCRDSCDERALRAHLSARLSRYKLPDTLHFVDALPRNANGKADRNAARHALQRLS